MSSGKNSREFNLLKVGHCFHPEAMVMGGLKWKPMLFPAIVGLIKHPSRGYILFDTGYAKRFNDETKSFPQRFYRWVTPMHLCDKEQLTEQLNGLGIAPEEINYIFISHFHADHIAGLYDFPKATFICSREGLESFYQRPGWRGVIKGYLSNLLPQDFDGRTRFIEDTKSVDLPSYLSPFCRGFDIFGDGSSIAIALPGHAFGHYGMLYSDGKQVRFLVGDACWTEEAYVNGIKPNPLTAIIMSDGSAYKETVQKLTRLYGANKELAIIPSHCLVTYTRWQHE